MQIGNKFRCYPTSLQKQILLNWIGCQRYIYNAKVGEDQYFRRVARKSLAHAGEYAPIDQQYSQFKTELTPWLSEVPSVLLRNGSVLWKQAYGRYVSKLGGRPTIHKKHGKRAVWLTSELFEFKPVIDRETGDITSHTLHVGTKKFPVGVLEFKAHREYNVPASLHISVHAGQWHISFNYDNAIPEPSEKDTISWLEGFTESELRSASLGLDRGVALPLVSSDHKEFGFTAIQAGRLEKQARHKKRWQRRLARRTKGSSGYLKAKQRVARYSRYGADVRRDVGHKTSYVLAQNPRIKLYVFEALKIKNMTRKAKPKQDEGGKWLRNGARAKSGLNRSILASTWAQTKTYLQYKARRQGKLVIEVPAFYSSQECAACGHTHPDNRKSQSEFVCQRCGNTENADHNAAKVIAARGVQHVLSGKCSKKESKRCGITKKKIQIGAEGSESIVLPKAAQSALGKIEVSRSRGNTPALWSLTQETPATKPSGL
jgi:putative transposase